MMYHCSEPIRSIRAVGALPIFMTFDIETSTVTYKGEPLSYMYIWQLCIGNDKERYTYYGRTWREYIEFVNKLSFIYGNGKHIVCYIFNAGYEFQFLRSIIAVKDMFATRKRVPVRFRSGLIEYRCAYKLTNMSLRKFLENEGVSHQKGELNYSVVRYSDTPLNSDELSYCENDVLGLHEALCSLMLRGGHNLKSIPYTSTGYVRREARERMQSNYKNRLNMQDLALSPHLYSLCKAGARGGNTHASFIHSNVILSGVSSYDITSSYPWTMLVSDKFPVTPWVRYDMGVDDKRAHLLVLELRAVSLHKGVFFPYIARAKCEVVLNSVCDNGRVVTADKLILICTEIDYNIILRQYACEVNILEHYVARRGRLPREFREYVAEMFRGKCELKGVDDYAYQKYKNRYNALFGMMLTDISQSDITYEGDEWREHIADIGEVLHDYYNRKSSFLSYQWGMYVTAIARERLQEALDAVGEDAVYCDTDSVKFVGTHDIEFDRINARVHALNQTCDISPICEVNGKVNELGIFTKDDYYDEFVTMGAKKYAYRQGEHYGVTVSGLNKEKGAKYLSTHGGLSAFTEGTIFDVGWSGRLSAHYDDDVRYDIVNIDGHEQEVTSNVSLIDTSYTLGIGYAYKDFLKNYENYIDI